MPFQKLTPPAASQPISRKANSEEYLNILVFKENHSSRAFQVPLGWISRLGIALTFLVALTLLSSVFAIRFFRMAHRASPARVLELEQELSGLKDSYRLLEAKTLAPPEAKTSPVTVSLPKTPEATAPVPPAPPPPAQSADSVSPTAPLTTAGGLFSSLPLLAQTALGRIPDPASLPIRLSTAETRWQGKSLIVKFSIQYVKNDTGNQQGRIVILARGPETLLAYPDGVMAPTSALSLVQPDHGEYFSVSRFRGVEAEFGPVASKNSLKMVEALIFNSAGQLILAEKIPVKGGGEP